MIPLSYYIILAIILFFIGLFGMLFRRNLIIMCVSIEIAINAVIILLASISFFYKDALGYILVFFLIAISAVEAVVGLTLIVLIYKKRKTVYSENIADLKG